MKKLSFAGLFLVLIGSAGCNLETREDLRKNDENRQMREQVSNIQKSKADVELKYSDIQNDMRVVTGRMEALDHGVQVSNQNTKQEIDGLKKTIEAQNEKIKLLQAHLDATEYRLTSAVQALSAGGAAASPQVAHKNAAAETSANDKGPFEEADDYFSSKEYKKAIVKYQNYIDKNPKGKNVAEATYKIALCFSELGLKKDAKEFYKDVIDNHSGSTWAKKAKYRLSHLK